MRLLRAACFQAYFFLLTAVLGVAGIAVRLFARDRALGFARLWAGLVLRGARRIAGIRAEITGLEHLPAAGGALLAAQHQSAFDTLVWMTAARRPAYVFKRELRQVPLFGPLLEPAGMIPVDRAAGPAALRTLLADAGRAAADGRQIIIFPEGTRAAPGAELPLQPGVAALAAALRLPVFPVATDSGLCWGRGLAKRPGVIHVAVGPALGFSRNRTEFLQTVRSAWRELSMSWHGKHPPVDNSVEGRPSPHLNTKL